MLTAFCLNPCIDRMVEIDTLTPGGMNRVRAMRRDASGKGINVAIVAQRLGLPARSAGFLYESGGDLVAARLAEEGVQNRMRILPGEVRENLKIYDRARSEVTEVNQGGVPATQADWTPLMQDARDFGADGVLVFTGSLPPGCPDTLYRDLMLASGGAQCVLDAEGAKLVAGLEAGPFLVKPNRYELSLALGRELPTLQDVKRAAMELHGRGARLVAVSMGGDGALLTDGAACCFAPRVPVTVRSTVGAGDCMVGGMLRALEDGLPLPEVLALGVAVATASVQLPGTQFPDGAQVAQARALVRIQEM